MLDELVRTRQVTQPCAVSQLLDVLAATRLFGEVVLQSIPPQTSSEDYVAYLAQMPGVFCFLGGRNEALGFVAANHYDRFAIDESVLVRGAA